MVRLIYKLGKSYKGVWSGAFSYLYMPYPAITNKWLDRAIGIYYRLWANNPLQNVTNPLLLLK